MRISCIWPRSYSDDRSVNDVPLVYSMRRRWSAVRAVAAGAAAVGQVSNSLKYCLLHKANLIQRISLSLLGNRRDSVRETSDMLKDALTELIITDHINYKKN